MVAAQQEESGAVVATGDDSKAVEGIKERLEFFFSDANIRQDAFIRKLLVSSDEKSVGIDALLRFNTIKKHSDKPEVLVKAAKELFAQREAEAALKPPPVLREATREPVGLTRY